VANALTVVLGWLEAAEEQVPQGTPVARAVRLAHERGQHGRSIALRAMGANDGSPEVPIACEAFVQDAIAGMQPQAIRAGVILLCDLPRDCRQQGVASPSIALQVVTNLLMNAVSFTPQNGHVTLHVSRIDRATLRFIVRDEGPGFEPDRAARVFDGLSSTRDGGCGIGLRHAHQLALEQGGRLRLIDPGPGAGFELCWPTARAQAPRLRTPSTVGLEGMRLLVVEDDTAVSMLLETALGARGATVDTAFDQVGMDALLAGRIYDAALVDLSPLEPDVVAALSRIRSTQSQPKLVLITGSATCPDQAVLEQASAWVRKPFEIGDIVAALLDVSR
jgi:CheY-like chemotaxis protein